MKPDILLVGKIHPLLPKLLEARFTVHRLWEADTPARREALLAEHGPRITGLVTSGNPAMGASRSLLERLPLLKIISVHGVGYDPVDVRYAAEKGIVVTNTPGLPAVGVGEMTLGLMLALARGVCAGDRYVRAGHWADNGPFRLGFSLYNKVCGIMGMGQCGQRVAVAAHALGMRIHYTNRSPVPESALPVPNMVHEPTSAALARAACMLVVCIAGGSDTSGMVNATILQELGPAGYLVNVSRGTVVDEGALIQALETGTIAGAALDVFAREPHVPEALMGMDNVVLTPHLGSATVETREAMAQRTFENLAAFYDASPLTDRVV